MRIARTTSVIARTTAFARAELHGCWFQCRVGRAHRGIVLEADERARVTRSTEPVEIRHREPVEDALPAAGGDLRAVGEEERVGVSGDRRNVHAAGRAEREGRVSGSAGRRQARRLALDPQHVRLDAGRAVVALHLYDVLAGRAVGDRDDRLVLGCPERGDAEHRPVRQQCEVVERLRRERVREMRDRSAGVAQHGRLERSCTAGCHQRFDALLPVDDEVVVLGQVAEPDRRPRARDRNGDAEVVRVFGGRQVREVEGARREHRGGRGNVVRLECLLDVQGCGRRAVGTCARGGDRERCGRGA